ncbi:MAG: hypothetical protein O7A08_14170 [SAR324 cluster bacterium]|nr:hypothetical protein [SAR324 cluster bacterium]
MPPGDHALKAYALKDHAMKWFIGIAAVMLITHFFFRRARRRTDEDAEQPPRE